MIDALFNQPDYLAAKKQLDAIALRQNAIARNIANLETPGYKRLDLAPAFNSQLERACAARDPQQIAALQPQLAVDATAPTVSGPRRPVHPTGRSVSAARSGSAWTCAAFSARWSRRRSSNAALMVRSPFAGLPTPGG